MSVSIIRLVTTATLLLFSSITWAQLTNEQQAAKAKGKLYYNVMNDFIAAPLLEIAAEAGDSESQFYLAELSQPHYPGRLFIKDEEGTLSPKAAKLYTDAASQGDIYAMIRLAFGKDGGCRTCSEPKKTAKEWFYKAHRTALINTEQGDKEAMLQMFLLTEDLNWLKKSAEAGFPEAQYLLGTMYGLGSGYFLIPGRREEAVERWLKASAEAGHPRGLDSYTYLFNQRKDLAGLAHWTEKAAESGDVDSVSNYAAWTAHEPDLVGYPLNLVKAYGLALLLADAEYGNQYSDRTKSLLKLSTRMKPEEIEAAKNFATEWKNTHPELSKNRAKYDIKIK
jgi:hypothetical protein